MITTTPYRLEDEPFLFELYASTRAAELRAWGFDEQMQHLFLTMQWEAQQRSYCLQYPAADHHILICQNVRAGRILVNATEQELRLVDITLLPDFCNQGIGTALLRDLQSDAADARKPLRLSVLKTNLAAKRLYERLGFNIMRDDGMYDFMEWRVTSV